VIVTIQDTGESKTFPSVLTDEIAKRAANEPLAFTIDSRSRIEENESILAAANNADVVLLAFAIRALSGLGHLRLPDAARDLVQRLPPAKTIAVSFGSPYVLRDLPSLSTYLCAYGIQPVMQTAAVRALYGEQAITGRLPVTIPTADTDREPHPSAAESPVHRKR
jgi:beta-N-acetylhexosaminidase